MLYPSEIGPSLQTISYQFILGMIKQKQRKSLPKLSISRRDYSLKRHNITEYLGCYLDCNLNEESMTCRVPKRINTKLNFYGGKTTI